MKPDHTTPFMRHVERWFAKRPGREFRLTSIPAADVDAAAKAGWLVGAASQADISRPFAPRISPGHVDLICIIRRDDPAGGRPLPGIFLLDGAPPALLPPKGLAGAEEQFCETMWGLALAAKARGLPLIDLLLSPDAIAAAAGHTFR